MNNASIAEQRMKRLRVQMGAEGVELVALGPGPHVRWLLGFQPHADERCCLLLVSATKACFVMPALNAEDVAARCVINLHCWSDEEGPGAALDAALDELGVRNVASVAVDETMRADFALLLLDHLPKARRQFTESTLGMLRMCKDEIEYASLKENAQIADRAIKAAFAGMAAGVTERQIAGLVKDSFGNDGAEFNFCIVAAGEHSAYPHHQTSDYALRAGDAVVIDLGAQKDSYLSDITRMAVFGAAPEGYADIHALVESALCAGLEAAQPGAKASAVDDAARGLIAEAGYGDYFVHRVGHGLGIEIHEPPYLTAVSQTVLRPGMVFSIEPGVYLPGRFGIRLEEIVILRDDGPEILSSLPRAAHIITA